MSLRLLARDMEESDISFVSNAWLKSYRGAHFCAGCPNELYYIQHHTLIKDIWERSNITILCDEMDGDQIYGFICYEVGEHLGGEIGILHYVYVKHLFRSLGLAKGLLEDVQNQTGIKYWFASHSTSKLKHLAKDFKIEYTPYVLLIK